MHVGDVSEPQRRYTVRRVVLPSCGTESWTVIGPDRRPVEIVDEYLGWLTSIERSPNTVEAYAHDLRAFWTFLDEHGLAWERVGGDGAWASSRLGRGGRRENVVVLADEAARLSPRTVNRMLTGVVGFYELQARRGNTLAKELVVQTRSGRGAYKPFLHGIARSRPRGRAGAAARDQGAAPDADARAGRRGHRRAGAAARSVLVRVAGRARGCGSARRSGCATRTSCRGSGGSRSTRARARRGARAARAAREGGVPVAGELMRLWSDYMHEEYGDLDCDSCS